MFAVMQFPITDVRSFAAGTLWPLRTPAFPEPRVAYPPEYLACIGPAVRRKLGADASWTDEAFYCRANRAFKYSYSPKSGSSTVDADDIATSMVRPVFKRMYSNGSIINRFEMGIHLRGFGESVDLDEDGDWGAIFDGLLRTDASVRAFYDPHYAPGVAGRSSFVTGPLAKQGHRLARLYADATSMQVFGEPLKLDRKYVEAGEPLLVVECSLDAMQRFADHEKVTIAADTPDYAAALARLAPFRDQEILVWMIGRRVYPNQRIRNLRVSLLRMHAARQGLDSFLRQLDRDRISYEADTEYGGRIDDYLQEAAKEVTRPVVPSDLASQTGIAAAFDASSRTPEAQTIARLEQRLDGVRNQVKKKIVTYGRDKNRERERVSITIEEFVMNREGDINVENTGTAGIIQVSREGGTIENVTVNMEAAKGVDAKTLADALNQLSSAILKSDLPDDKKTDAIAAVGAAKKDGLSKPDKLVEHLADAGKVLSEANTTIEKGAPLWESIKRVGEVLAPVVGTAATIGKLFGLLL